MARSQDLSTQKINLLGRFSYAQYLFEPNVNDSGKKQWQLTVLFPKTANLAPLEELAASAVRDEWGDKGIQWIKDGIIKTPFLDGDGKQGRDKNGEVKPGYAGHRFIRCMSGEEYRPKLLNSKMLPITSRDELKSGDYGFVVLNAYTWDNPKNGKGVSFGMSYVMKAKDGESLGGGGAGRPEDHFEAIPDEGAAPEAAKSGAGAAGLFG